MTAHVMSEIGPRKMWNDLKGRVKLSYGEFARTPKALDQAKLVDSKGRKKNFSSICVAHLRDDIVNFTAIEFEEKRRCGY